MCEHIDENKIRKYYDLAKYIGDNFSKDPNTKVGALLLYEDTLQIISTGYNGFPRNIHENQHRWERPHKYKYVVHAEMNIIYNSARNGACIKNSILVVTLFPCSNCSLAIIQSGIKIIITKKPNFNDERWGQNFKNSLGLLTEANITILYI